MPQIMIKNVDLETVRKISGKISSSVAEIINVPIEHIVVEYNNVEFFRCGEKDEKTAMIWVSWKKRPAELQEKVAKALAEILFEEGYSPVETVYDNLNMDDFYEYFR